MSRNRTCCVALAFVVSLAGCRMCTTPYDECGPLMSGECGEGCSPTARAGSILSGTSMPVGGPYLDGDSAPYLGEMTPETILSITEGDVVEDVEVETAPYVIGPIPHVPPSVRSRSQGWTSAGS